MDNSTLEDIENLIRTYNRRLRLLEEERAFKGRNTAPEIKMEIEDIKETIKKLRATKHEIVEKKDQLQGLEQKRIQEGKNHDPKLLDSIRGLEEKLNGFQSIIASMRTHTQRLQHLESQVRISDDNRSENEVLKKQVKELEDALTKLKEESRPTRIPRPSPLHYQPVSPVTPLKETKKTRPILLFIVGSSIIVIFLLIAIFFAAWTAMSNSGVAPTATSNIIAAITEPTDPPELPSPIVESDLPTREPTVTTQPLTNSTVEPITTPTAEPITTPTIESNDELIPSPPPVPTPIGKLAIPLGGNRIIIAEVNGTFIKQISGARHPDYWQFAEDESQPQLVVNGVNPPLDKLRVLDGRGITSQEIGNPGLAGHSHPVWSVDGTRILYDDNGLGCSGWCAYWRDSNIRNDTGDGQIFVSSGNQPIAGSNALYPQWTTGDRIVFRSCASWAGSGGNCGLWVATPSSTPTKLTNNASHIPTDVYGDTAVFVSNEVSGDDWNVYTVNLLDGTVRQLTSHPSADGLAAISPDGRWVAFVSQRDNSLAIWYMALDGSTLPQKLFDISPSWGVLAPDAWFEDKLSWGR